MSLEDQVRQALLDIEQTLRASEFWQSAPPDAAAFSSKEPFCLDTMSAEQWLQWVLLPRMHAMLDGGAPLPRQLAIAPYFEEALTGEADAIVPILARLRALDALFPPAAVPSDTDA